MKKVLAVFLAILMLFSCMSVIVFAEGTDPEDTVTETEVPEETGTTMIHYPDGQGTTTNILNDDGLVFPSNWNQLKMSFVFKIVERIINFFLGLFGGDVDANLTDSVSDFGVWLDEAISNIEGSLN